MECLAWLKNLNAAGNVRGAGRKVGPDGPTEVVVASVPSTLVKRMDTVAEKRGWGALRPLRRQLGAWLAH